MHCVEPPTLDLFKAPNLIPEYLAKLAPVYLDDRIYFVTKDYVSVGDDFKNIRMPMTPKKAQALADILNCILPTPEIVNAIWGAAAVRLDPIPLGPPYDSSMMGMQRISEHDEKINRQLSKIKNYQKRFDIVAGHKKDIVICNELAKAKDKVAIYGWHKKDGTVIQNLSTIHGADYFDYSHGVRLVSRICQFENKESDITDVLRRDGISVFSY